MDKAVYTTSWIGLTCAIESAASVVGRADAWSQIKQAIRDGALHSHGILDGIDGRLCGRWISILAFDDHGSDCLFFRPGRLAIFDPPAPECAERVEVNGEQFGVLWPSSAVRQAGKRAKRKGGRKPV